MNGVLTIVGIIVCLVILIAFYNRIEKLKRTIEEKEEDLTAAKTAAERKESKMLVSFSEQTSALRKQIDEINNLYQVAQAQLEQIQKEMPLRTADRDNWKKQAQSALEENSAQKALLDSATQELEALKLTLQNLQAEKTEWQDKYQTESQHWNQQKKLLVDQIRGNQSPQAENNSVKPTTLQPTDQPAPQESPATYEVDGIKLTTENMVLGEATEEHPERLTNALIYEGVTQIQPIVGPAREEGTLYPTFSQPKNGVSVLTPCSIHPTAKPYATNVIRKQLQKACADQSQIQLLEEVAIPIRNRSYGYVPDIALYVPCGNFYIAIEIDAPYSWPAQQPTHYLSGPDHLLDLYLNENGWVVFRMAEQQAIEYPEKMVDLLWQQLAFLTNQTQFYREVDLEGIWIDRWTFEQAQSMAASQLRSSYLPQEALQEEQSDNESESPEQLPDITILTDPSAEFQKRLAKMEGHPYTKVTLRTNDYDYLFVTGSAKEEQQDYERGWTITDIIEQKKVFIPFAEVAQITGLDSLWLHPELVIGEDFSMEDWEALCAQIKEAAYGTHPVHLQQLSKEGESLELDVLFLSHWLTQDGTEQPIPSEQAAAWLFGTSYLRSDLQDFAGWSLQEKATRVFSAYQIKRFSLYNCHKPGSDYGANDLWSCLEAGLPQVAKQLYAIFTPEKQEQPDVRCNYAHACLLTGETEKAMELYLSINKKQIVDPAEGYTWQTVISTDLDQLSTNSDYEAACSVVSRRLAESWTDNE